MLAHLELEAKPRNSLGIPLDEATDPKNEFAYVARNGPLVDFAERVVGAARDRYYENNKDEPRHGHMWLLRPSASEGSRPSR